MISGRDPRKWLRKKAKKGAAAYPIGTIAYYGSDNHRASKLVASVLAGPDREADPMRKWFADDHDLRSDADVSRQVAEFFQANDVRSVAMMESIIGCPHEEGIDYPVGEKCPECPFWANRDRWTHDVLQ